MGLQGQSSCPTGWHGGLIGLILFTCSVQERFTHLPLDVNMIDTF